MTQPTERHHLTPDQAAVLDGFEAWRKWRETRGLRRGDWVQVGRFYDARLLIRSMVSEPEPNMHTHLLDMVDEEGGRRGYDAADCRLHIRQWLEGADEENKAQEERNG